MILILALYIYERSRGWRGLVLLCQNQGKVTAISRLTIKDAGNISYGYSCQRKMVSRNANIVSTASTNIISRLTLELLKQQLMYQDVHLLECT